MKNNSTRIKNTFRLISSMKPYHLEMKEVSFTAESGKITALAGHSGAGKSTCVNLILREKRAGITA